MEKKKELLIGAHTSAAGGVQNALYEGQEIGATTIQLFTSNQRQWAGKKITADDRRLWNEAKEKTGITTVMSHDSYLINLGASDPLILEKSIKAFKEEIQRCHDLDITYLNFHPGTAGEATIEECIERIITSLLECAPLSNEADTQILLEATAGQGTTVGWRFEELASILHAVKDKISIGVCIDTCHIFAAGYDIRTALGVEKVLQDFDRNVGLKYLAAFHLNDSKKGLGSRVDRHADLGAGEIGIDCFKELMQNDKTKNLPKYLETPGGKQVWKEEIKLLKGYYAS